MSLLDVLRAGVAVADTVTKPLQATVTYARMVLSGDGYGTKTYPVAVPLTAIVEWKTVQLRTATGVMDVTRPHILFLNIGDIVAATGGAGIGEEDKITLPDGTTGPIRNMGGFMDAGTGHPIATELDLG